MAIDLLKNRVPQYKVFELDRITPDLHRLTSRRLVLETEIEELASEFWEGYQEPDLMNSGFLESDEGSVQLTSFLANLLTKDATKL